MPTPPIFNVTSRLAVIVNALAPALKTIPLTSVFADKETAIRLLAANVAISDGPLGMVSGFQFSALFQLSERGFAFHVAVSATLFWMPSIRLKAGETPTTNDKRSFSIVDILQKTEASLDKTGRIHRGKESELSTGVAGCLETTRLA